MMSSLYPALSQYIELQTPLSDRPNMRIETQVYTSEQNVLKAKLQNDSSDGVLENTRGYVNQSTQLDDEFMVDVETRGNVSSVTVKYNSVTWDEVREELQWALQVHIYVLFILFVLLACYTFSSIHNMRSRSNSRPFMVMINVFVCVLGVSRAFCIFLDPFRDEQVVPVVLTSYLWDIGHPCIVSGFSLVQLAFSKLTRVDFKPKKMLCGKSIRVMIVFQFATITLASVLAAFSSNLKIFLVVVKGFFICWALVIHSAFLYGGTKLLKLLHSLPNSAFTPKADGQQNKGILQLALLAQCNNIASSVLNAAQPTISTPKIKITDENERSFNYSSGATKRSPTLKDIQINDNTECEKNKMQSSAVKKKVVPTPESAGNGSESSKSRTSSCSSAPLVTSPVCYSTPLPTPLLVTDAEVEDTGVFSFEDSATKFKNKEEPEKFANVAEPTGDSYIDDFIIPKIICSIEETLDEDKNSDYQLMKPLGNGSPKRKKSITWVEEINPELDDLKERVKTDSHGYNSKLLNNKYDEGYVKNRSRSESNHRRRRSSTLSTSSNRKSSFTSDDHGRKGSISSFVSSRRNSSITESHSGRNSLSFSNSGRKGSISNNSRRDSFISFGSSRKGSGASFMSSRKSSLLSRKGSDTWDAQNTSKYVNKETQERINKCLDTSIDQSRRNSCSSPTDGRKSVHSRRNTLVNTPANVELETLVAANASEPPGDLTLSCILNHIAFLNQTEISAQLGARIKESRKEQVKQVLLVAYITAVLGVMLSLILLGGIFLLDDPGPSQYLSPWLWFFYISISRILELAMGCAMANITRQSVTRHSQYAFPIRMKHGNKMYV